MSTSTTENRNTEPGLPEWYTRFDSYGYPLEQTTTNTTTPTATTATAATTTVTGYPRVLQAPPSYTPTRDYDAIFFVTLLVLATVIYLAWEIAYAIAADVKTPRFQVDSVSVSPLNVSNSQLTAKWNFSFFVENPNRIRGISYDSIEASVFYKTESLAGAIFAPFRQASKNHTSYVGNVDTLSEKLNSTVANAIARDMAEGEVDFDVKLQARMRFIVWATLPVYLANIFCGNIKVGFGPNATEGTMVGGFTRCSVHLRDQEDD